MDRLNRIMTASSSEFHHGGPAGWFSALPLGLLALAAVVALGSCGGAEDGPGGTRTTGFAVTLSSPSVGAAGTGALVLDDGASQLVIDSAEIVLNEIEFEQEGEECESGGDDNCAEAETGPMVVALPTDGSVEQQITVEIAPGTYDEVEFEVHRVDGHGDDGDAAILEAHPEFEGISIRVTGTYDGAGFVYTSALNVGQEVALSPPLVVGQDTGPIAVTLSVDVAGWFKDGSGALIDPATALAGGENEQLVVRNIRASFEVFEDDDGDGEPDDDEHDGDDDDEEHDDDDDDDDEEDDDD